jgi:cobalt-zinc-cadmium efflux system membrane fusion protein
MSSLNTPRFKQHYSLSITQLILLVILTLCGGVGLSYWAYATYANPKLHDHAAHEAEHDHDHPAAKTGEKQSDEKKSDHQHGESEAGHEEGHGEEHEEIVALTDAQIKAMKINIAEAAPQRVHSTVAFVGEVRANEDRLAHVVPRLAGVVERVAVNVGQVVKQGQLLAVIASQSAAEQRSALYVAQQRLSLANITYEREKTLWMQKISAEQDYLQAKQARVEAELAVTAAQQKLAALGINTLGIKALGVKTSAALNQFELRAPFDGVVTEKHLSLGEAVKEDAPAFVIADMRQLWVDMTVPVSDLALIKVGDTVTLKATGVQASQASQASQAGATTATLQLTTQLTTTGKVAFIGALVGEQTRMAKVRVTFANPQGVWRPGLFVNASVNAAAQDFAVAVPSDAIQTIENRPVVFVKQDTGFKVQVVQLGRTGFDKQQQEWTEIVSGLVSATPYAAQHSFIIKAELGKSTAEHTH